mmetsp:Transcript_99339/g.310025  ORF Transcript_99339/g.310025 Transcript_99339/m.310025 type:complete len:290 (-) Transcript_99339:301-1170(-)
MPRRSFGASRGSPAEAIVVFNGCFCPVHAGHVRALEDTKRKLEADGKVRVVAGYFAVAPDHYVRKKLQGGLEPWMTAAARVELCRAVARDVGWAVSAEECESWKRCGAAALARNHAAHTELFGVRAEAKQGGVSRKGDGATAELSSTVIRAELAEAGDLAAQLAVVDGLVGRGLLGHAVGQCLKRQMGAALLPDELPAAAGTSPQSPSPVGGELPLRAGEHAEAAQGFAAEDAPECSSCVAAGGTETTGEEERARDDVEQETARKQREVPLQATSRSTASAPRRATPAQ